MNIPKSTNRYRPRADAATLSRLVQEAWEAKRDAEYSATAQAEIAKIALIFARELYPLADMQVLSRYGVAEPMDRVDVSVYDPATKHFDSGYAIELPEKILAPRGRLSLQACAVRYSEDPLRGLHPAVVAEASHAELEKIYEFQNAQERGMLPRECDPYFAALRDARKQFKLEYRDSTDWPAKRRAKTEVWPTWAEIADAWPVLGAHLRKLWSAP